MDEHQTGFRALIAELRRRHVFRAAGLYAAVAWLVIQAASTILPRLDMPEWSVTLVIVLALFGFPLALVLAWSYDLTPDGVRRTDPVPAESAPRPARLPSGGVILIIAIVAVAAGMSARYFRDDASGPVASAGEAIQSIAVLPFQNAGTGTEDEYLSDGIAEELLHRLARLPDLRVAARTSSFAFRGTQVDVREIGSRLNVDVVLEGSVRSTGNRLRIGARLVETRNGYQLWSEVYELQAADVFRIQDEISAAIVRRLRPDAADPPVPAAASKAEPESYEAFQLFLRGRYEWNRRTEEGLRSAVRYFEQAIARSPQYARAHLGLADATAVLGFYDYVEPTRAFPQARTAAEAALALDPDLTEAHATLAYVALYHDYDVAAAETGFRRAIELNPGYAVAHQWYANLLVAAGRFDEAIREIRRSQALDPLALIAHAAEGWVYLHARDYERAVAHLSGVLEQDSSFFLARLWLGQALELDGQPAAAEAVLRGALGLAPHSVLAQAALARALAGSDSIEEARGIVAGLESRSQREYVASYEIAAAHLALGDTEAALTRLASAAEDRAHALVLLDVDARFDALRGNDAFDRIAQRVRYR